LNLEWPNELPCANDDCLPVIIDVTIEIISKKALKKKKCEEICKKIRNQQQLE
jgi:hypothetical protein